MRTTITLEEDVAVRLQAEARKSGRPFKVVVNEFLRAGLAQRRATRQAQGFTVEPFSMGAPPAEVSYDDIGALLESLEGAGHR